MCCFLSCCHSWLRWIFYCPENFLLHSWQVLGRPTVHPGDVVTILSGCRHAIIADEELSLIEIQVGSIFYYIVGKSLGGHGNGISIHSIGSRADDPPQTACSKGQMAEKILNEECINTQVINELNLPILCMGCKDRMVTTSPGWTVCSASSTITLPFPERMVQISFLHWWLWYFIRL